LVKKVEGVRYPWLARVINFGICTGAIISSRAILFASHCMKMPDDVGIDLEAEVTLGVYDISTAGRTDIYRGQSIIHPDYLKNTDYNDIAVIITEREIEFSENVRPICLPDIDEFDQIKDGDIFNIVGYGVNTTLTSILNKYRLIKTKQLSYDEYENAKTETRHKVIYDTLEELIPDLKQIMRKDLKLKQFWGKKEYSLFTKQNLEKLESTMIGDISDEIDKADFKRLYPTLIEKLQEGDPNKMINEVQFVDLVSNIARMAEYQYHTWEVVNPTSERDEKAERTLIAYPTGNGDACKGDSGGPAAFDINGKYFIVGVARSIIGPRGLLIMKYCYSTGANNPHRWAVEYEYIKPHLTWIKDVLKKNNALPKL